MIISGLEGNKMHLKTSQQCLKTQITGLYSYMLLYCGVHYDINNAFWELDSSIKAEFSKEFSMMTSLMNIHCL